MDGVLGVAVVVLVRLVARVVALVAQRLLVHPDELLVRREQVQRVVQLGRVRQVVGHEVVEPADGARVLVLGRPGGQLHQALHRRHVLLPLLVAEVAPGGC